jgi:hypothetical protein
MQKGIFVRGPLKRLQAIKQWTVVGLHDPKKEANDAILAKDLNSS